MIEECVRSEMFTAGYADIFAGDRRWQSSPTPVGDTFDWGPSSTYIRNPPDFERISLQPQPVVDIVGARVLAMLGDSVTTDHISPVGAIKPDSPAGRYLHDHGVSPAELNSYPTARGEATTR